jgi:hypothetical protein
MGEYRDCVEAYQTIIRRFPKNEIVPICYLNIANAYVEQARLEFQNPDILALAELNVRKFQNDFPRDERVAFAEESVCLIKEMYAKGLCDLGLFYERIHQPDAAAIYFQSSIEEFPDTNVAQFCRSRLICLGYLQEETCACEEAPPAIEQAALPCEEVTPCIEEPAPYIEQPTPYEQPASYAEQPASYIEQPASYVEQFTPYTEQPTPYYSEPFMSPPVNDQRNQTWEPMSVESPQIYNYQAPSYQAPVYYEDIPPQQEQGQEYIHYSLTKKREARYPCGERQSSPCQQEPSTWVGKNPNSSYETPNNGAPYEAWHYSSIKHRDQYAPCQD